MSKDKVERLSMTLIETPGDQFSIYDTKVSTETAPTSRRPRETSGEAPPKPSGGSESSLNEARATQDR